MSFVVKVVDGGWWMVMVDGVVNVDDNVKWRRALCGCSALSPKRRHQRKINQQRDVAKCFFRELSDTFFFANIARNVGFVGFEVLYQ